MGMGPVRYARNGSVRLAYRVAGDSETPVVFVPGWISNVDTYDDPTSGFTQLAERLSASTRLVVWDKRGTGLSDPVTGTPPLDERMDDLQAVMDAAEVTDPVLWGASEGGPMSLLFAATYPARVRSLVLYGTAARFSSDPPDHPWGFTAAEIDAQLRDIDERWGEGALVELFLSSIAEVEGVREFFGRSQRAGASPTMAWHLWQALMAIDVRDILGSVDVPTLVLHRRGDRVVPFEAGAALADRMPNATLRELPPGDHVSFDLNDLLASEILGFVAGETRFVPSTERVLATVLFTDIVSSTETVSARGRRALATTTQRTRRDRRPAPVAVWRAQGQADGRRGVRRLRRADEGRSLCARSRPRARDEGHSNTGRCPHWRVRTAG